MSDQYEGPDPWDEGPGAMRPPTAEEEFMRGDISAEEANYSDYYAYIAAAAASIGRPDLAGGIEYFGVDDLRGEQMTPRLVDAIESFHEVVHEFEVLSPELPGPELEEKMKRVEAEARSAAQEAWEKQETLGQVQVSESAERMTVAKHVDEGRRIVPSTPFFDRALKARQEEISSVGDRGSAGRVRAFLEEIRWAEMKNDVGLTESDIRGLEQSRNRGHGRGR